MKRFTRRTRITASLVAILIAVALATLWREAVEYWIAKELRALAAAHLKPSFDFDALHYSFPRSITLSAARLSSPDPQGPEDGVDILAVESLTVALDSIPQPGQPLRMRHLDLAQPTIRLVPTEEGGASGHLLGFSDLLKETPEHAAQAARPAAKFSETLQVRSVSIADGRVQHDPRDGAAIMLIEGISAKLLLEPGAGGSYAIDFTLDHASVLELALHGRLEADEKRFDNASLSVDLKLAREHDHYLTPAMQKFLAHRDIAGQLKFEATGALDLHHLAKSRGKAQLDLSDASYDSGGYGVDLDRLAIRVGVKDGAVEIEEFTLDTLGGHASIGGSFELDDATTAALRFDGRDLEIGGLLRGSNDPDGVPRFSGLLDFTGTLGGPLSDLAQRVKGEGRLSLREARLGRFPVLATIDRALDATAEAFMKRETNGHAALSLRFSLEGNHGTITKLRMNDRWYGLRGHGDVYFDSRLDLKVDGGPVQRLQNELGVLGDVLGEITETLLRASVTGTVAEPKVGVEILRQPVF